jgi:hypothetical protein
MSGWSLKLKPTRSHGTFSEARMTQRTLLASLQRLGFAVLFLAGVNVFAQWTEPVPMEPHYGNAVKAPWISNDGLRLYVSGTGYLFMTSRDSLDGPWGPLQSVGDHINSGLRQESPCESPSGDTLYFMSWEREGIQSFGYYDIYYSVRADTGWGPVQNCGENINSFDFEWSVGISRDGQLLLVSSDRWPSSGRDLFYSERQTDGTWGPLVSFGAANRSQEDEHPCLSPDNNTLFFYGIGPNRGNVWMSRKIGGVWQTSVELPSPVNSVTHLERDPCIASDGRTLWFVREDDDINGYRIYTSVDTTVSATGRPPIDTRHGELRIVSPSSDRLTFLIPQQLRTGTAEVSIYNVLGRLVVQNDISLYTQSGLSRGEMSMNYMASGSYFVRVQVGDLSWNAYYTIKK